MRRHRGVALPINVLASMFFCNILLLATTTDACPGVVGSGVVGRAAGSGTGTATCNTCNPTAACCCKSYSENDPLDPSSIYCPCMASPPSTVELDEYATLTCRPGNDCLGNCGWTSPAGSCSWRNNAWSCDEGLVGAELVGRPEEDGACDIRVLVTASLLGNWTCHTQPFIGNVPMRQSNILGLNIKKRRPFLKLKNILYFTQ